MLIESVSTECEEEVRAGVENISRFMQNPVETVGGLGCQRQGSRSRAVGRRLAATVLAVPLVGCIGDQLEIQVTEDLPSVVGSESKSDTWPEPRSRSLGMSVMLERAAGWRLSNPNIDFRGLCV